MGGPKIAEADPEKNLGKILDDRYTVDSVLEVGGMGTVYEGIHIRLGRQIAVKVLHGELIGDEVQTERFLREAKAAAEIHHRNVVDVIDIGTTDDGRPYFVMELLRGEALKVRMKRLRIMAPSEIGWIIQHALAGLGVAHEHGVIHRDVKPGNIFISREKDGKEIAKILDFGVAKFKFRSEQIHAKELTTTGTILGTPYFMSPEQAMGKKSMVDARSDIYSCGLIVYRGLTGRNPFRGENYNEVIYNILTRDIPPPSMLNKNVPEEVDRVVMKAVARDPDDRYQTCKDFIEALDVFEKYKPSASYLMEKRQAEEKGEPAGAAETDLDTDSSAVLAAAASEAAAAVENEEQAEAARATTISHSRSLERRPSPRRKIGALAARALALVVVAALGVYLLWIVLEGKGEGRGTNAKGQTGAAVSKKAGGEDDKKQAPPAAGTVSVSLKGVPEGARIKVGGVEHDGPRLTLERSGTPVMLEIAKDGFSTFMDEIVPDRDLEVEVPMAAEGAEAKPDEGAGDQGEPVKKKKKKKKGKDSAGKKIYTTLPDAA
jgi:tRNA A-37 threonylcarbamoyl transferase component Bud32